MAPSWIPLCRTMQVYCEPYFTAIERWRNYENHHLLINRINLIETADKIFIEYSQNRDQTFEFDLQFENQDAKLLPEVIPSAGKNYQVGGDKAAYEASRNLVPPHLFNRIGLFFQNFLLKQIAGHSDTYLETANVTTRQSIITSLEKLFQLPEDAGKAYFIYRELGIDGPPSKFKIFSMHTLSETAKLFTEFLIESAIAENPKKKKLDVNIKPSLAGMKAQKPSSKVKGGKKEKDGKSATKSKKAKQELGAPGSESDEDDQQDEDEELEPVDNWLTDHESVGTKVARYFPSAGKPKKKILYQGKVVKYAPPSNPKAKDQLYHVVWEDDDSCDLDQKEFDQAVEQYRANYGWITEGHPSIGVKVASYFEVEAGTGKKLIRKLYRGHVEKYSPPTSDGVNDQLYRIVFEDGDVEDYDEEQLQAGRELLEEIERHEAESRSNPSILKSNGKEEVAQAEPVLQRNDSLISEDPEEVPSVEVHADIEGKVVEEEEEAVKVVEEDVPATDFFTQEAVERQTSNLEASVDQEKPEPKKGKKAKVVPVSPEAPRKTRSNVASPSSSTKPVKPAASKSKPSKKKKTQSKEDEKVEETQQSNETGDEDWTQDHPSVGTFVSAFFPAPAGKKSRKRKQLYTGKVARYAPETAPGEADQLYHVVWEDGDEQDYDEKEYQEGLALYQEETANKKLKSSSDHDGQILNGGNVDGQILNGGNVGDESTFSIVDSSSMDVPEGSFENYSEDHNHKDISVLDTLPFDTETADGEANSVTAVE